MTSLSGTNFNNREAVGPKGEGRDSPSSFPVYPEFKSSGIEWLGDVPKHWSISKFARHFQVRMGETIPEGELTDDGWLPVYSATEKDKYYGFVSSRKPLAKPGDLIIPARGNSIGHVKLVKRNVTATQTTIVANNLDFRVVQAKFAYYWSTGLREILFHFDRTAIPQITTEYVSRNKIVLPNLKEQTHIARFLDYETARIDALIEEQRRLIELLKEKRQAVISHAVTKGLDPNVPMKDSGVEWLGEVPEHWTVGRVRNLVEFAIDGPHFSPSYVDEGVLFLSARNIKTDRWSFSDAKFISQDDYEEFSKRVKPVRGDVLLTKGGTTGIARAVDFDEPFQVWVHIAVLRPIKTIVDSAYLSFVLNSKACYEQSQLYTRGATNNDLGLTRIINIILAWPSLNEQQAIVGYLDKMVGSLDAAAIAARDTISLLKERRSALISAAVTGKIDVRNWQPNQSSAANTGEDYAMVAEQSGEYR